MTGSLLLLAALLTPASLGATAGWLGDGRVGAGWQRNLDAAEDLADGTAAASWTAGAGLTGWVAPGRLRLLLGADYGTVQLPAYPALSQHAVLGHLRLRAPLAWHLDATAGPFVGGRWVGDSERDALDVGGGATLAWRARPWLRLEAGYRYTWRDAAVDVYDRDAHALFTGAEALLWRGARLSPGLGLERGPVVMYSYVTSDIDGDGQGPGNSRSRESGSGERQQDAPSTSTDALGDEAVAWSSPAWTGDVQLALTQELGDHLALRLAVGAAQVWTADSSWQDLFGTAGVTFRLP